MGHKIKNFAFLVFSFAAIAAAQKQNMGPTAAPQINSTFYVGAVPGWYATIQLAVTAACTTAGARVQIPAGSSPADTPTAATGCTKVAIVDQRTLPDTCYSWSGSAYVASACASGAANPGGAFQNAQFNNGTGGFGGSKALLNPNGDFIALSYGGTRDAMLNQSGTSTNDGIRRSLQTAGSVVTVNQDYPVLLPDGTTPGEGVVAGNSWRSPRCCGATAFFSPGFADNTVQVDWRPNNSGLFFYNAPGLIRGNIYDLYLNDFTPQTAGGGFEWVSHEIDRIKIGSGKNQQNLGDSGNWDVYALESRSLIDLTRGISSNSSSETFKGQGDYQDHQCQVHAHGDDPDGSGEGKTCYRNQMLQDAGVWFGPAVQTYATGATVVQATHNAGEPYMYDGDYLVDSTQAGAPFYMAFGAVFDESTQTPGTILTPSQAWTPDNWGKQTADMGDAAVPQMYNGAGTPVVVSVSGLSAAFSPSTKVCVGDEFNDETIQIPSSGTTFTGGTMTFTANFRFWHPAGTTYAQGPQACKFLEVLANQAATWRNVVRIIGAKDAHTLMYSAHLLGGWANQPDGSFSTANFPSGTAFVRDASGNVTITIPGIFAGGNWLNQQIVINANSGLDSSLFGNWGPLGEVNDTSFNQIITFATGVTGAAGTFTSTGPVYVSKFGVEANTGRLMPGAEIVYAGNPSTHVNDGTAQIELNDMTVNVNDQIESQAPPEVVINLDHDQIQMLTPTSGQSPSTGYYSQVTGRPNAGFSWHVYADNTEPNYFQGDGGTHTGMTFAEISGSHYAIFWSLAQPMSTQGGAVFLFTGCGVVPNGQCADIHNFGWSFLKIATPIGGFGEGFTNWNSEWQSDLAGTAGTVDVTEFGGNFPSGSGGAPAAGYSVVIADATNGTGGEIGNDVLNGTYLRFHHGGADSQVIAETSQVHLQVFGGGGPNPAIDLNANSLTFPGVPTTFPAKTTVTFDGVLPCLADGTSCPTAGGIANIIISVNTNPVPPGCATPASQTMTGVTANTAFAVSDQSDFTGVTGWDSPGAGLPAPLYIRRWPTLNTFNYRVCNRSSSSVTPSASVNFTIGAVQH